MNKKKKILISTGALFIGANLYLTFKENSKVDRSSYITAWGTAKKENVSEKLKTAGVVTPLEEHHLYYNENSGEFKSFLVAEGDKVESGSTLYEFSSDKINESKNKLQSEQRQLEREVALINEQIQQLNYLKSVSKNNSNTTTVAGDGSVTVAAGTNVLALSIDKEIYDKQTEKNRLESEIDNYDQLIESNNSGDLEVKSHVDGTVKSINVNLQNPIVTIVSDMPKVEGTFTEEELKEVEVGMKVSITSDLLKKPVKGTLTKIATYPESDPSVKKKSLFPFEIELEKQDGSSIIQGTHTDVVITTKEVKNAITVQKESIAKNKYVYVLNDAGKITRNNVTKGIATPDRVQIEKGIQAKERLVLNPKEAKKAGDSFITPLKPGRLEERWFKAEPKMEIFRYIAAAFVKR
ncbi:MULTISPECIES: efflux RND transporter periplasmic adaptor subunit [unclassified Bacillus (in: firmicutes)]|uniref:efflux RND transporter periplasmic adaptor subunit n=1 Tax=unclassified Bacillus (in: firmicutes) TaxID=185979 RepID=UPI0008ED7CFF|nr:MULTISPECIES: HlyD family efflux transporter periplasmic adaptor subunit [unclassified Bacillus (in: firmicutes)]SFB04440.1 HlyD family secretion protein [Bacillus sp. UNCCL13]SFQ88505.1 HlyD family secretion protein [Bacillus sp. cl95]